MIKEILVHIQPGEREVAITSNGDLDDFFIEKDRTDAILGNIYKGRVESVLPSINGAFVNIGQERNGFLYLTDAVNPLMEEDIEPSTGLIDRIFNRKKNPSPNLAKSKKLVRTLSLKKADEVLVQVVKEPFGTKGARLTTHITLPGRFVVFMPYDKHFGVSKRIEHKEERVRLREVLKSLNFTKSGGFIVRTASLQKSKGDLVRDAKFLFNIWKKIKKTAENNKAPALIYQEYDLMWKIVRDMLTEEVSKLIIDSEQEYARIRRFVHMMIGRKMLSKIEFYQGDVPLFESKQIQAELNKIFDKRVHLKSGAYIVIEPTEGVIVVDVNSGKFKVNASPEEAAFMVNKEAAVEIARQLRLRDLGGIIVIDFIDMNKDNHKRQVLDCLKKELSKDHTKSDVSRISSLGLVEMTRARTGKTVESLAFGDCPYCQGRGRVKKS